MKTFLFSKRTSGVPVMGRMRSGQISKFWTVAIKEKRKKILDRIQNGKIKYFFFLKSDFLFKLGTVSWGLLGKIWHRNTTVLSELFVIWQPKESNFNLLIFLLWALIEPEICSSTLFYTRNVLAITKWVKLQMFDCYQVETLCVKLQKMCHFLETDFLQIWRPITVKLDIRLARKKFSMCNYRLAFGWKIHLLIACSVLKWHAGGKC